MRCLPPLQILKTVVLFQTSKMEELNWTLIHSRTLQQATSVMRAISLLVTWTAPAKDKMQCGVALSLFAEVSILDKVALSLDKFWDLTAHSYKVAANTQCAGCNQARGVTLVLTDIFSQSQCLPEIQARNWTVSMTLNTPIPCKAPVAQLVRASDWHSENPGSNPDGISKYCDSKVDR